METISQRDFLSKNAQVPLPGFTDKSINKLVTIKQSPNLLNIETNHLKRDFLKNTRDIIPLLEYQLWLEAGKLDKANFKAINADANVNFNSNIWRNFCSSVGLTSNRKSSVTESVATMYPINIPLPSRMGSNTLSKYYEQNRRDFFSNDKSFALAREKVEKEDARMRFLRLKSEMRNPPLDWQGNILPPQSFKKYTSVTSLVKSDAGEVSLPKLSATSNHARSNTTGSNHLDMINDEKTKQRKRPVLKKLVYRENHPDFNQVVKEQQIKAIFKKTGKK